MSPSGSEWRSQSQSYRMGFVEAEMRERNSYRLQDGASDSAEYERGFADGLKYWWPDESN